MANCFICKKELDGKWGDVQWPADPRAVDCGGDCLQCMAECGDPDAQRVLDDLNLPYTKPYTINRAE